MQNHLDKEDLCNFFLLDFFTPLVKEKASRKEIIPDLDDFILDNLPPNNYGLEWNLIRHNVKFTLKVWKYQNFYGEVWGIRR